MTATLSLMVFAFSASASAPHTHRTSGKLEKVDAKTHTLTIASHAMQPSKFFWNDNTKFKENGRLIDGTDATPGESAIIRFRNESGQCVARSVDLRRAKQ